MKKREGSKNRPDDVRPSGGDRCAECGGLVGNEWFLYKRDFGDPNVLRWHCGVVVKGQPETPEVDPPKKSVRDFQYPDDLGVFFHRNCAPRVQLSEEMTEKLVDLLANVLVADLRRNPPKAD